MDKNDPFYIKSKDIPDSEKVIIINNFDKVAARILEPPQPALEVLFKQFNEHINDYPNDIKCSKCRKAIFGFWKQTIKFWTRQKLI